MSCFRIHALHYCFESIGELLKRSFKDNMYVSSNIENPNHLPVQKFRDRKRAAIVIFKHVISLRKSNLDVRPSVVAFELRVRLCLVIQMHAGNIEITPTHSKQILISV